MIKLTEASSRIDALFSFSKGNYGQHYANT